MNKQHFLQSTIKEVVDEARPHLDEVSLGLLYSDETEKRNKALTDLQIFIARSVQEKELMDSEVKKLEEIYQGHNIGVRDDLFTQEGRQRMFKKACRNLVLSVASLLPQWVMGIEYLPSYLRGEFRAMVLSQREKIRGIIGEARKHCSKEGLSLEDAWLDDNAEKVLLKEYYRLVHASIENSSQRELAYQRKEYYIARRPCLSQGIFGERVYIEEKVDYHSTGLTLEEALVEIDVLREVLREDGLDSQKLLDESREKRVVKNLVAARLAYFEEYVRGSSYDTADRIEKLREYCRQYGFYWLDLKARRLVKEIGDLQACKIIGQKAYSFIK